MDDGEAKGGNGVDVREEGLRCAKNGSDDERAWKETDWKGR